LKILVYEINGGDTRWILGAARDTFPTAKVIAVIPGHQGLLWIKSDCILEFKQ
jgi:hypothetical protein